MRWPWVCYPSWAYPNSRWSWALRQGTNPRFLWWESLHREPKIMKIIDGNEIRERKNRGKKRKEKKKKEIKKSRKKEKPE